MDIERLSGSAASMAKACGKDVLIDKNPGLALGLAIGTTCLHGQG